MAEQIPTIGNGIEIRIEDISQLFHTLDPFPFHERDLDKDAEEFIVSWARELPVDQPLRIVVHLPEAQASTPQAHEIGAAITGYFAYRARIIVLELKELFRLGRRALAIGVTVLSFSVIIGQAVAATLTPRPVAESHRRESADFRVGRELAADRNISVRMVADRPAAQPLPAAGGGAGGIEALWE